MGNPFLLYLYSHFITLHNTIGITDSNIIPWFFRNIVWILHGPIKPETNKNLKWNGYARKGCSFYVSDFQIESVAACTTIRRQFYPSIYNFLPFCILRVWRLSLVKICNLGLMSTLREFRELDERKQIQEILSQWK